MEEGKGRGIEVLKKRLENEVVCTASALFYDDLALLQEFLKANPRFRDRVVKIDGTKKAGSNVVVYAVLVGVAQYIQHYQGIRPRANATLRFRPSSGFNSCALEVIVSTRTGVGIAAGGPVLLDYGPEFDLADAQRTMQSCGDVFSGALDAIFNAQRRHLPEAAAEDDALKAAAQAEADRVAAEEAAAAEAAKQAAAQKAAEEEQAQAAARQKEAEEAEAARQAALEAKRKQEAVNPGGAPPEPKRQKTGGTIVNTLSQSSTEVVLEEGRLFLRGCATTNKKVSGDTALVAYTSDAKLSSSEEVHSSDFGYDLTMKSDIIIAGTMKRSKLDKYIKELQSPISEIYGYSKFPVGNAPKVLVKKGGKSFKFRLDSTGAEQAYKVIEAARVSKAVSLHWIVKHVPNKEQICPCGLAILLVKAVQVPGNGGVFELA